MNEQNPLKCNLGYQKRKLDVKIQSPFYLLGDIKPSVGAKWEHGDSHRETRRKEADWGLRWGRSRESDGLVNLLWAARDCKRHDNLHKTLDDVAIAVELSSKATLSLTHYVLYCNPSSPPLSAFPWILNASQRYDCNDAVSFPHILLLFSNFLSFLTAFSQKHF